MKSILLIDTPENCAECHLRYWGNGGWSCICTRRLLEGPIEEREEWCPLRHPLKEVNSEFYIYDRKFLFDHLDKEFAILKDIKAFEDFIKARETE